MACKLVNERQIQKRGVADLRHVHLSVNTQGRSFPQQRSPSHWASALQRRHVALNETLWAH